MRGVRILFSCGHAAWATADIFREGETVEGPCTACRPFLLLRPFVWIYRRLRGRDA